MLNDDYREMLQILLGNKIPFISKKDLIKNKRSTGRIKDSLDADHLSKNQEA